MDITSFSNPADCPSDDCSSSSSEEEYVEKCNVCEKPKESCGCKKKSKKKKKCKKQCVDDQTFYMGDKIVGNNQKIQSKLRSGKKYPTVNEELKVVLDKLKNNEEDGYEDKLIPKVMNDGMVKNAPVFFEFSGTLDDFSKGKGLTCKVDKKIIQRQAAEFLAKRLKAQIDLDAQQRNVKPKYRGISKTIERVLKSLKVAVKGGEVKTLYNELPFPVMLKVKGIYQQSMTKNGAGGIYIHRDQHVPYHIDTKLNEHIDFDEVKKKVKKYSQFSDENIKVMNGRDRGDNFHRIRTNSALCEYFVQNLPKYYDKEGQKSIKAKLQKNPRPKKLQISSQIAKRLISDAKAARDTIPMHDTLSAKLYRPDGKKFTDLQSSKIGKKCEMSGTKQTFQPDHLYEKTYHVVAQLNMDYALVV